MVKKAIYNLIIIILIAALCIGFAIKAIIEMRNISLDMEKKVIKQNNIKEITTYIKVDKTKPTLDVDMLKIYYQSTPKTNPPGYVSISKPYEVIYDKNESNRNQSTIIKDNINIFTTLNCIVNIDIDYKKTLIPNEKLISFVTIDNKIFDITLTYTKDDQLIYSNNHTIKKKKLLLYK